MTAPRVAPFSAVRSDAAACYGGVTPKGLWISLWRRDSGAKRAALLVRMPVRSPDRLLPMLLFMPDRDGPPVLFTALADAQALAERVYVVDGSQVSGLRGDVVALTCEAVPKKAILNARPYMPPRKVAAGGGYVVRGTDAGPELLLIHRRGAWDLPKGKRDGGEGWADCARREVREELGIRDLRIVAPLGATVHGYEERGRYCVKPTRWYAMTTPHTRFTPQAAEGIEAVEWVPYDEALARLSFDTLRTHARLVRPVIDTIVAEGGA